MTPWKRSRKEINEEPKHTTNAHAVPASVIYLASYLALTVFLLVDEAIEFLTDLRRETRVAGITRHRMRLTCYVLHPHHRLLDTTR